MRYLGCHVSTEGGFASCLTHAQALGINTLQCHPSPPQRWNSKPFAVGYETEYLKRLPDSGVERVFFHAIYLINLANPDPSKVALSVLSLQHHLDLLARIGGHGVIVHVGSAKHADSEQEALTLAAQAITRLMDQSNNQAKLLLEVAAGSGAIIGDKMIELATIYDKLPTAAKKRVGFALDTQHLWGSGYDLAQSLDAVVAEAESCFGLDKIGCIHLNDSKVALGSRVDRHENLGLGTIGMAALTQVLNHPKLADIPFILETPGLKEPETARREVELLQTMANTL